MIGPSDPAHSNPGGRSRPLRGQLMLSFLIGLTALSGAAIPAGAECVPESGSVQPGDTVACTGDNFSKYIVPVEIDQVTIDVAEGASFQSLDGAIVVRDQSNVSNSGSIYVTGIGTVGISAGAGGVEESANYEITATGRLDVLSELSRGMNLGGFSNVTNEGIIQVGHDSIGVNTLSRSSMSQNNQLLVSGDGAIGVSLGASSTFDNSGSLIVSGEDAIGALLGANSTVENFGRIEISGAGSAVGLETSLGSTITNWTDIEITESATGATGLLAGDDFTLIDQVGNVSSAAASSVAIRGGADTEVEEPGFRITARNRGTLNFSGAGSVGIQTDAQTRAENSRDGVITFTGDSSTAILTGQAGWADNYGQIEMQGDNSRGLVAGDGTDPTLTSFPAYLVNFKIGTVSMSGDDSIGMQVGQYGWNENRGAPAPPGQEPPQNGVLIVTGDRSTAMRSGPDSLSFNQGLIQVGGTDSVGVHADGYTSSEAQSIYMTFLNDLEGKIESIDPNAGPLILLGEGVRPNTAENAQQARIEADTTLADVAGRAIAIQGSDTDDIVINYGHITGKVRLGTGSDIYRTSPGAELTDLGEGTVDGGEGEGFDIFALAGTNAEDPDTGAPIAAVLDARMIRNFDLIRIEKAIWMVQGNPAPSAAKPTTDLQVASGGTLQLQVPFTLDGNYSHEAPSEPEAPKAQVLAVLDRENSDTPLLHATGTVDLANGDLQIVLGDIREGGTFNLIESDSPLLNSFELVIQPDFAAGMSGEYIQEPGSSLAQYRVRLPAFSSNQMATSTYLNALPTSGLSEPLTQLLETIDGLSYEAYGPALNQLMPEAYDAQAAATLELANTYTDLILARPNYCIVEPGEDSKHPSTGLACQTRRFEPWMSVYGQKSQRTGTDDHISYHDEGGGLVVGLDHRVSSKLLLTGAVGTAYDVIRVDDVGKGRLTTVDIGLAGAWADGPLRIQGVASYGYGWNHRYRNVAIENLAYTARAEYSMNRVGLRGRAEYAFRFWKAQIAPLASLDYTALIRPVINENSGGPVDLHIEGATHHVTTVRVGFDLSSALHKKDYWTEFLENVDGVWRPSLSLAWRQVVTGQHREITSRLSEVPGSEFTIRADAADRGFEIGAGIDWSPKLINRFTFGIHYDGFLWQNVRNHNLVGSVRFSF